MSDPPPRPDPDALLRRVNQEEARLRRGKLRVFFGFAPGVGKTYRMLQVARDLVSDHDVDLVLGIVETHRRMDTAAMTLGLELLPRRKVMHRGRELEELDLDRALARKPRLILVDELAHTNAPGSRHPKRWQDVEELLDAGIDVFSTMNVQHVESLNDVVAQITRVNVRETVPDRILDAADSIELVDIAPEELLTRLEEGKVYLPEEARRAATHFFRRGNLLALRELALRRTAQHVDDDVREYREEHGVSATWPAGERILVAIGPSPSSARLVGAAARMAGGLRCPWAAAYVETPGTGTLPAERARLEAHLQRAESLGATIVRLPGTRVAEALLGWAQRHNVTRLIIGKPTHSRLRDRLRGSLLDEVVRGSHDIDVSVIGGEDPARPDEAGVAMPTATLAPRPRPSLLPYAATIALVGLTLGLAMVLRAALGLPDLEMLFLLVVLATAVRFGRGPALTAAALGVACYDFFFVPPELTFDVSDKRYFLTFAMMFGVGFVASELTARIKRQEREAIGREERTAILYAMARDLATADTPAEIAEVAARHATNALVGRAVVLGLDETGTLGILADSPRSGVPLDPKDLGVARWCVEHGVLAGLGTDTLPGSLGLATPLRVGGATQGALLLFPADREPLRMEQRAFVEAFGRQVAVALERAHLAGLAHSAALRARAEEMRSSLLSAVSHDLRTPLASITGAATSLRDDTNLPKETRDELVQSICVEAVRLERLVTNLLDMTRLDSGALSLARDWIPLEEIVGSALTRLEERLGDRPVTIDLPADLPLLYVDPVLYEQLFLNLFENAAKYTPRGASLTIRASLEGDDVVVDVMDGGPGLPPGAEERVFEKFYRGPHAGVAGVGLGLPICRGIAEAHGGTLRARNLPEGGAAFRVRIPRAGDPPSLASSEAVMP